MDREANRGTTDAADGGREPRRGPGGDEAHHCADAQGDQQWFAEGPDGLQPLAQPTRDRREPTQRVLDPAAHGISGPLRWQKEAALREFLRDRFYPFEQAVRGVSEQVVRASSIIENINSRLRSYFFLRREIGAGYLELLQFFLNHRRFLRSECPERVGKSPAEILTGQPHPHWLEMLGYRRSCQN